MGDHWLVKVFERAARAELRGLGVALTSSVLARALVDLARRLDEAPEDPAAVALSREMRQVSAALHRAGGVGTEAEAYLARMSAPAFSPSRD